MYGGMGVRAAPLRLRLPLVDLSGAQNMHKALAGPWPTSCTFQGTVFFSNWQLSLVGSLASPFVPSHPRFHKHICLLLSNSPVPKRDPSPASFAVPLTLAYISRHSLPSLDPRRQIYRHLFFFLFLFLFVIAKQQKEANRSVLAMALFP
jgi:hypothetical protein